MPVELSMPAYDLQNSEQSSLDSVLSNSDRTDA